MMSIYRMFSMLMVYDWVKIFELEKFYKEEL